MVKNFVLISVSHTRFVWSNYHLLTKWNTLVVLLMEEELVLRMESSRTMDTLRYYNRVIYISYFPNYQQLDVIATLPGDVGILSGGHLEGEYQILQLHFHWGSDDTIGSEHTLDGKRWENHKETEEEHLVFQVSHGASYCTQESRRA